MQFVLDASVTMAWCFEDETTARSDAILDELRRGEATVPILWHLEIANVLLGAERRGRLTEVDSRRFVGLLSRLPIRVDGSPTDLPAVLAAGRTYGLTSYDASYFLLAQRLDVPLATSDQRLAAACRLAGVGLACDN